MSWVLRRVDGRGAANYVARPGNPASYVTKATAREYPTKEAAQADACGNEVPEEKTP